MALVQSQGVSFIMAIYDASTYLIQNTIDSIQRNAPDKYEIILQVNSSSECHVDELTNLDNVLVYKESDTGIYNALNRAIVNCKYEWLMVFGAGDLLLTSSLFNRKVPEGINVLFGNTQYRHNTGPVTYDNLKNHVRWNRGMYFCHQSCITRKSAVELLKGFSEKFQLSSDYHLYLRMKPDSFMYVPGIVSEYILNGQSYLRVKESIRERVLIRHQVLGSPKIKFYIDAFVWEIFLLLRSVKPRR